jgi:glyoxylase-like metal-dependent hydrolase (beta-lactamase superfamily II)
MPMRVADRWWERRNFENGITQLWEPHVHPLVRCNVWHVRGRDRDLVVDTGIGVASVAQEIEHLSDRPVTAVATHIHWDHVGCLHEFEERLMHSSEAHRMNPYEEFAAIRRSDFDPAVLAYFDRIGYEIEGDALIDALPSANFDLDAYRIPSTTPTRRVEEGDAIDLGDRRFEVWHLPGHSPGSIGLWEAATRTLFSGDAIYDGPLIDVLEDSSVPDYLETMKRLRDVPAEIVHGGHDASFGREKMIAIADAYLADRSESRK